MVVEGEVLNVEVSLSQGTHDPCEHAGLVRDPDSDLAQGTRSNVLMFQQLLAERGRMDHVLQQAVLFGILQHLAEGLQILRIPLSDLTIALRFSMKISRHMGGFDPAILVRSLKLGPLEKRALLPPTASRPARCIMMFARTCGAWLMSAIMRSCTSALMITGVAPIMPTSSSTSPRASSEVSGDGARKYVALRKRSARAKLTPALSAPQIGCPPTNLVKAC